MMQKNNIKRVLSVLLSVSMVLTPIGNSFASQEKILDSSVSFEDMVPSSDIVPSYYSENADGYWFFFDRNGEQQFREYGQIAGVEGFYACDAEGEVYYEEGVASDIDEESNDDKASSSDAIAMATSSNAETVIDETISLIVGTSSNAGSDDATGLTPLAPIDLEKEDRILAPYRFASVDANVSEVEAIAEGRAYELVDDMGRNYDNTFYDIYAFTNNEASADYEYMMYGYIINADSDSPMTETLKWYESDDSGNIMTGATKIPALTKATSDLTINKVDSVTGEPLEGAVFDIYKSDHTTLISGEPGEGTPFMFNIVPNPFEITTYAATGDTIEVDGETYTWIAQVTTNGLGTVSYDGLTDNYTYIVKETTAPKGYKKPTDDSYQKFAFEGEATELTFENEKCDFKLIKTDAIGHRLEGADFTLTTPSGESIYFVTDANGEWYMDNLEAGTVQLKEGTRIQNMMPYSTTFVKVDGEPYEITVANYPQYPTGSLALTPQVEGNAANPNDSFTYSIYTQGTQMQPFHYTLSTGESGSLPLTNGSATITLKAGVTLTITNFSQAVYYVPYFVITQTATVYSPLSESLGPYTCEKEERTVPLQLYGYETVSTVFTNVRNKKSVTIEKTDKDTGEPLEGAVFDVYREIINTIPSGSPTTPEITMPEASSLGSEIQNLFGITTYAEDHPIIIYEGKKYDYYTQITTNADGLAYLDGFTAVDNGGYLLKEITAPDGYKLSSELTHFEFNNTPITVEVENEQKDPDFDFTKEDALGRPMANVPFTLTKPDGSTVDFVTDKNGKWTLKDLDAGTIKITEHSCDANMNMILANEAQYVKVDGEQLKVTITNVPATPTAVITLKPVVTGNAANSNDSFTYEIDTHDVQTSSFRYTLSTGESGHLPVSGGKATITLKAGVTASLSNLSPLFYYSRYIDITQKETVFSEGSAIIGDYTCDKPSQRIDFSPYFSPSTAVFTNTRDLDKLTVIKTDKATGEPLAGAVFDIYSNLGGQVDGYPEGGGEETPFMFNIVPNPFEITTYAATGDTIEVDGETYTWIGRITTGADGKASSNVLSTVAGFYLLHEATAPAGYQTAPDVTFDYDGTTPVVVEVEDEANGGTICLEKKLAGSQASAQDEFTFEITSIAAKEKTLKYEKQDADGVSTGDITFDANGKATIANVKGGDIITIANVPNGDYQVTESDSQGYTPTCTVKYSDSSDTSNGTNSVTGTIAQATTKATFTFTNTKALITPPTGIGDSPILPVIFTLGMIGIMFATFMFADKKKKLFR